VPGGWWRRWRASFAYDTRTKLGLNTTQTFKNAPSGAAEWVVETQGLGRGLSDFGKVIFTACHAYSGNSGVAQPISHFDRTELYLVYYKRYPRRRVQHPVATPGPLTKPTNVTAGTGKEDGFRVAWNSYGK
jgi:hypothetical protein